MQDFVEYILKKIVNHPEDIKLNASEDDKSKILEIQLHEEDKPLVIGKQGRNIKAIRDLSSILMRREDDYYYIKILD